MAKNAATAAVPRPPKTAADTRTIFAALSTQHPNADTELHFTNAYELLVATILSAQCTDERVNQVTPALFKRYPDAAALSRATTDELEPQIQSTGFFRAKSRSLLGMATELIELHQGRVPRTMDELVKLPGVGRKTANVVLGHALGVPGLPVDRHVLRVAGRIGIASSEDPEIVEQQLGGALPPTDWTRASDTLILHGRRICKPRPLCPECIVRPHCLYYRNVVAKFTKPGVQSRAVSRLPVDKSRAPKARGQVVGVGPHDQLNRMPGPKGRAESRLPVNKPRAPKARGTARGGGAPRETK